jgi:hypothetical protein
MSRYFEAPDAYGEPCLWEAGDNPFGPDVILERRQLRREHRHLWPLIVEAVTSA